jgi:hypothetical protein
MATPARLLIYFLLRQSIKERVTHLTYIHDGKGGVLYATNADETFEVIPPPASLVPRLIAELATLAHIEDLSSRASGAFQLVNTTHSCMHDWHGDRPISVDVTLSADRFDLQLTYSDTPVAPVEVGFRILPT